MPDSTVTLVGNLTRDPELSFTTNGSSVAKLGIAVNRRWQNKTSQEWEEQTSFFNIVVWNDQAGHVADTLHKGDRVVVTGRLDQRSWETTEGEKRSTVEVVADEVAPSLRWATGVITKVAGSQQGSQPSNGQAQAPRAPQAQQQPARVPTRPTPPSFEEDPF